MNADADGLPASLRMDDYDDGLEINLADTDDVDIEGPADDKNDADADADGADDDEVRAWRRYI